MSGGVGQFAGNERVTANAAGIRVSMNGLRNSLVQAYNEAVTAFRNDDEPALQEALWDLRRLVGSTLCIYEPDSPELFRDMSDELDKLLDPPSD